MTKVLVTQSKLDTLAEIVGGKSNTNVPLTLDEMITAADSITSGGGSPTLETVTKTYTPSTSAVTDTITPSAGYDGIEEVDVTVSAVPLANYDVNLSATYATENNSRKFKIRGNVGVDTAGWITDGDKYGEYTTYNAIAKNTSVTPTESAQTIGGNNVMMEGAVTVNAIPSNYVGSGVTQRTSSDLTANNLTVTAPSGYYASSASKTLTDANLTAENIKKNVTIFGTTGSYEGGGGGAFTVATATKTLTASASSISFTSLSGEPTSFVITSSADQTTGGTKAVSVAYDGTNLFGMDITTQMENDTGFTKSYSGGTLTITATSATFEANEYKLVYTYGGSSSDIHTSDVQVGSGATSITFSSLSGKPAYFSCVFKSTFGTSSGYQRVIDVVYDGTNTYGNAMDSSAKAQTSWSYSYSGGSLTISSTGTNNGGYFHQPGYYQLTYGVDPNEPNLQTKTNIGASTSSQTITADNGYDGLESVQINAVSQTNLVAGNIKSGTTVTISNGSSNLWSVTGTYGGGGGSMNVQTSQSTSRTTSTTLASVNSLTCSTSGTYDVYWTCTRSSTSGTWSSRLYVGGTASGSEQTTWSNHVQTVKLTGVTINANQTVAVYAKSRGSNYYAYAPQLTIVQTA